MEADADRHRSIRVPHAAHGATLQDFLERHWPTVDRKQLRALVRDGAVSVNYDDAHGGTKVRTGDAVRVELPSGGLRERSTASAAAADLVVLAETDHFLVVDKPAGVPSIPDRSGREKGVYGQLQELRPDDDLRIAHRLDRDTSGCLVLARGLEGARWLDRCFREQLVHKEYLALVEGRVARDRIEIRRSLGPDRRRPGYVTVVPDGTKKSRTASTDLTVDTRFRDHTLVRLRPHTGRGHQLRAHLRSIGHPIVSDVAYGAPGLLKMSAIKRGYKARAGVEERPLLERFFLHAISIEVPLPDGSDTVSVSAPIPADLERVLTKLRRFAPSTID